MKSRIQFIESPEWQAIARWLMEQRTLVRDEALLPNTSDAHVKYYAGMATALDYLASAPFKVLVDPNEEPAKDILEVVNPRPKSVTSPY